MKAAVVVAPRRIEITDVPVPRLLEEGDVLIKVQTASICNTTDYKSYTAPDPTLVWPNKPHPFVLGHECYGTVVEVSKGVQTPRIGDRVVFWTTPGGGFAEYVRIRTEDVALGVVDDKIPPTIAPVMEMVIGAARLLFSGNGPPLIARGAAVVVFGLGPAGLIYVQLAKAMGAKVIMAVGHGEFRLQKSRQLGAHHTVDSNRVDPVVSVMREIGVPDVIVDATGADIFESIISLGGPPTLLVPYGVAPFDWTTKKGPLQAKGIKFARGSVTEARAAVGPCIDWVSSKVIELGPLVTDEMPLADAARGLEKCQTHKDRTLKVILHV